LHRAVIQRLIGVERVQLIRVLAGGQPIGVAYNLVLNGKVYFYQSGLQYSEDNKNLRPGVVTLFYVIQHCMDQGLAEYDMMAGNSDYKKSLSSDYRELDWVVLERHNLNMRLLKAQRYARRLYLSAFRQS